jgi:hypothetical protein
MIFRPDRDDVTEKWRNLHNEGLQNMYYSRNNISVIKLTTGFGNIRPIHAFNIFNKGGQRIPYTFKWQKYLDINFANEEHPFIIPYQTLAFWTGTKEDQILKCLYGTRRPYRV